MYETIAFVAGAAIGALLVYARRRPPVSSPTTRPEATASDASSPELEASTSEASASGAGSEEPQRALYAIAEKLQSFFQDSAYPSDLLDHEAFLKGVEHLNSGGYDLRNLVDYAAGVNPLIGCMALEALARRDDARDITGRLVAMIRLHNRWLHFFVLRALNGRARGPVVPLLLARLDSTWDDPASEQIVRDFLRRRMEQGETPAFTTFHEPDEDDVKWMETFLTETDRILQTQLLDGYRSWQRNRLDLDFLKSFGRVLDADAVAGEAVIEEDFVRQRVGEIEKEIRKDPPRSVLLVGEAGVGKKTALQVLLGRLLADGWTVFEASAAELMAGQMYIGQLEERVLKLIRMLEGKERVLWVVLSFQNLLHAGRHRYSQTSVLDILLPFLQAGGIRIAGEIQPGAYERVVQEKPGVKSAFETIVFPALPDHDTLRLARLWVERHGASDSPPLMDPDLVREGFQLSRQYLGDQANPGCLLGFLTRALELRRLGQEDGDTIPVTLSLDDLLTTLTRLTGLPASILDERQGLNLDRLRAFFHEQVMGQPEAVACLTERVAMIKAGLTDPTRPQGVFLFTGPTGTGKTEIAKTLAEFLFGSPDRMIRLDMSEFQTADTLVRLLGEGDDEAGRSALVHQIRKQPFSVILLDEFEKAHHRVWDLFLQVFDDGRLTDRTGNTADFRHAIVILTVNVGSEMEDADAIGFGKTDPTTVTEQYQTALTRVFRREFLNRIDRVVVFRPLSRTVMREVLHKELAGVFERRGLRKRQWAVEWDASALDFLLARGFSARYGARPLKRAVERYLLSPLALTIVNHQVPEGDQFLFVRSDGQAIQVEFIDPDAPAPGAPAAIRADVAPGGDGLRLPAIVLAPTGSPEEVDFLSATYAGLEAMVEDEAWKAEKGCALEAVSAPDFWNQEERFVVLGRVEYMDRIESGLRTSGSLLSRIQGTDRPGRKPVPSDLVRRLAQHLYLIQAAMEGLIDGRPRDAFVQVESVPDARIDVAPADAFAARLVAMYEHWARKRGMHLEALELPGLHPDRAGEPRRFTAAVSGYAAFDFLIPEQGLHVLETPGSPPSTTLRHKVKVLVAPQPDTPPAREEGALLAQARECLSRAADVRPRIARRYREEPSPLVRDNVRGWRTGRIDQVLAGDFDLF
jgi:ATP-dependent Clp protease ATP-binding subunit ClpC